MRNPIPGRDAVALAILIPIGVGVPLWLAATAGTIGLPTIDDWVYMRGAANFFHTGIVDIPGHAAAAVGQILMVQPLLQMSGGDAWAFTAFGLIMTAVGAVATYLLARRFVGVGAAAMSVLLVEAFPGFARLSASFMTDIPAYALSSLCLLGGAIWLERGTRSALLASIAFGVLAVSVREFAVAAPGSVLLVSWLRSRKSDRVVLSLASALFAACLVFVLTVATSTGGRVTDAPDPLRLIKVGHVFLVLSAMLLPVVALRAGHWLRIVTPMQLIVGAALGCIAAVVPWGAQGGDLWMGYGVGGGGLLYGGRNPVIPPAAWLWSGQVAAFAAIALATLTVRWVLENLATVRSWSSGLAMPFRIAHAEGGLLTVFVIAYAAELVAFSPIALFDRYLFPILPAASILILSFGARTEFQFSRAVAFSNAAFAWLAVSAFLIAANAFAYDAARWRQGEIAVKMGYEAGTVDAGYEWVGYHSVGDVHLELSDFHLAWYDNFLLRQPPCVVAASTPPNGSQWHLIRVTQPAYLKFLFFGSPERLALWLADVPECLHPPQ